MMRFAAMKHSVSGAIAGLIGLVAAGCGDVAGLSAGGDFGATPGGVQDMGLARDIIAAGNVPPPEAFVVEGMFSEHELGLAGPACQTLLCLRSAVAVAPDSEGQPAAWLQVGMSSTIDPDAFERPSLTLILTVDVSGSMGWEYPAGDDQRVSPGTLSRSLLHALTAELGPADRVAMVTYGSSVATPLSFTPGDDRTAIAGAIDRLGTDGATNMEAGMERAYQLARESVGETDQTRVIVFTDVQPNVGATIPTEFEDMARSGADAGIGLTVMGMGLGMGQQTLLAMSHLRGGNAFSFTKPLHVDQFIEDDWPFFVSPIAYDLSMAVEPEAGLTVAEAYGFPGSDDGEASLDVSTVFLSRRKGALLVRLDRPDGELGNFSAAIGLGYTDISGDPVTVDLDSGYQGEPLDERGHYYEQSNTGKTVALALLVSGMHEAAELYGENRAAAVERMTAVSERFAADAANLADVALDPEVQLAADLLSLMESGAPQGDFYPY